MGKELKPKIFKTSQKKSQKISRQNENRNKTRTPRNVTYETIN